LIYEKSPRKNVPWKNSPQKKVPWKKAFRKFTPVGKTPPNNYPGKILSRILPPEKRPP